MQRHITEETYTEMREIIIGNMLISRYMYPGKDPIFFQVGYTKKAEIKTYRVDDLADDTLPNFHNDWGMLMEVIASISKDKVGDFSEEEIIINTLKNYMFEFAFDPKITWYSVLAYIKVKTRKKNEVT